MAYILIGYVGMAYIVMAYIVMASSGSQAVLAGRQPLANWQASNAGRQATLALYSYGLWSYIPYIYGLCDYGLCSYGLCSYGLCSYGRRHVCRAGTDAPVLGEAVVLGTGTPLTRPMDMPSGDAEIEPI